MVLMPLLQVSSTCGFFFLYFLQYVLYKQIEKLNSDIEKTGIWRVFLASYLLVIVFGPAKGWSS